MAKEKTKTRIKLHQSLARFMINLQVCRDFASIFILERDFYVIRGVDRRNKKLLSR